MGTSFSRLITASTIHGILRINPDLPVVLGGVSSCDCDFRRLMTRHGVMEDVDAVGIHGFPLDWNHWQLYEWPSRIAEAARPRLKVSSRSPLDHIRICGSSRQSIFSVGVSELGAEKEDLRGVVHPDDHNNN